MDLLWDDAFPTSCEGIGGEAESDQVLKATVPLDVCAQGTYSKTR